MQSKVESQGSGVSYQTECLNCTQSMAIIKKQTKNHNLKKPFNCQRGGRIKVFVPLVAWSSVYIDMHSHSVGLLGIQAIAHPSTYCMWQQGAAAALPLLDYQLQQSSSQKVSLTTQKEGPALADKWCCRKYTTLMHLSLYSDEHLSVLHVQQSFNPPTKGHCEWHAAEKCWSFSS